MKQPNIYIFAKLIILIPIFSVLSCNESTPLETEETIEPIEIGYPNVDERLWPFFERFEQEATDRGIIVDLKNAGISGEIAEIDEERVAGTCNFNRTVPNHVTIDQTFWENANFQFREFVVFHELGHCQLFRDHKEDINANGTCQSIMRSGNGECIDNYNSFTRRTYLNELFDPQFARDIFDRPRL